MTATASPALQSRRPAAPVPTYPLEGEVVDASAPTFRWSPIPGAERYTLEVAAERSFGAPLLRLDAGASTELVLHDQFAPREQPLLWRVRAEMEGGNGAWSLPGRFVAGADRAVDAFLQQRDADEQEGKRAERRRRAEEQAALDLIPPHSRPDHIPSDGQVRLLGALFILGALLSGLVIFFAATASLG